MKLKAILITILSLVGLATLSACGPNDDTDLTNANMSVTPSTLSFTYEGGEQTVTVTSTKAPTALSQVEWLKVEKKSATANTHLYTITAERNDDADARTGEIFFTLPGGTNTARVKATQSSCEANKPAPSPGGFHTAKQIASLMYPGWNLGNTMEATGGETSWQSTKTTQAIINYVKQQGFRSVRIPCSWDIHSDSKGKIDAKWMSRVKEVVGYCINAGLYVELNDHWDNGWIEVMGFTANRDSYKAVSEDIITQKIARLQNIWTQIAEAFIDYDEHLLFGGLNEPFQEYNLFNSRHKELTPILQRYNAAFVEAVRATGGNNANRTLVVQGPATNIDSTVKLFSVPESEANGGHLMVEVHYYDPWDFTGNESTGTKNIYWGTAQGMSGYNAESHVEEQMKKMYDKFVAHDIPVIIGEYGANWRDVSSISGANQAKHDASIRAFHKAVNLYAISNGCIPMVWDINHIASGGAKGNMTIINRQQCTVYNTIALEGIKEGVAAAKWPY